MRKLTLLWLVVFGLVFSPSLMGGDQSQLVPLSPEAQEAAPTMVEQYQRIGPELAWHIIRDPELIKAAFAITAKLFGGEEGIASLNIDKLVTATAQEQEEMLNRLDTQDWLNLNDAINRMMPEVEDECREFLIQVRRGVHWWIKEGSAGEPDQDQPE